jgi:nitrogenase molybdenum-iron protein alpha chain
MNYMCKVMEEKYGIPWIELNFFGPTKIRESLRALAELFDDSIKAKVEAVIAKYDVQMQAVIDEYRPRLAGKSVMLYVGGLRPRHTIGAYEDLGMTCVGSGYEFAHSDDYDRTAPEMPEATVVYDDASELEMEHFAHVLKPDLVASGIKEKYVFQKMGLPFRQMHSWDYSGPYHGYKGFPIFARDIDMAINSPTWKLVKSPF